MGARRSTGLALAAVSSLVIVGCGSSGTGDGSDSLVFVNYGGSAADAMQTYWMDPFAEDHDIDGRVTGGVDTAKIKAMVDANNVTWDVVEDGNGNGAAHCGTLYAELDSTVDLSSIDPNFVSPDNCGVPILKQSVVLVYNKDKFGDDPPTDISAWLNTEDYPGKRLTLGIPIGTVEPTLLAGGVEPDDLYPLDMERFFTLADGLGSDLDLEDSLGTIQEAIASGNFSMALMYNGRLPDIEANGGNFGVVWDRSFQTVDYVYVVKGTPNEALAMRFLNYIATPEAQERLVNGLPYAPTTTDPNLPAGVDQTYLPTSHPESESSFAYVDAAFWASEGSSIQEEWADHFGG